MEKFIIYFSLFVNIILSYKYVAPVGKNIIKKCKRLIKHILLWMGLYQDNARFITSHAVCGYIARGTTISYLTENKIDSTYKPLPNTLVIKPGYYFFAGKGYDLTQEGLCRFMLAEKENQQRIIYENETDTLMSSLAWMMHHGSNDDHASYHALIVYAKKRKLCLTCESMSKFAVNLLKEMGIKARIVGSRTLDRWNNYDNGHYLIEVYREDILKWVLYDLDSDTYFTRDGDEMSLIDFIDDSHKSYQINYLSNDIRAAVVHPQRDLYDYTFLTEGRLANLTQWYERIMQFAFLQENESHYSCCNIDETVMRSLPKDAFPKMTHMTREMFINKFYQS